MKLEYPLMAITPGTREVHALSEFPNLIILVLA